MSESVAGTSDARTGKPHPAAVVVGLAISAGGLFLLLEQQSTSLVGGELIAGAVAGVVLFVGALVGGGKATRLGIFGRIAPGSRLARQEMRKHVDGELGKMSRPIVGALLMGVGALALLLKPVVLPVTGRRVTFDGSPPTMVEWEYFEAAHRSFVLAGAVLLVLTLVLLVTGRSR